jgi:hypothetical protein
MSAKSVHEVDTKSTSLMAVLSPTARHIREFLRKAGTLRGGRVIAPRAGHMYYMPDLSGQSMPVIGTG